MRMRFFPFIVVFAANVVGCGTQRLAYVTQITPYDGQHFPSVTLEDDGSYTVTGGTTSVDTRLSYCSCSGNSSCVADLVAEHFALIFIRNDYPADDKNPLAGRISLNSFQLSLSPVTTNPKSTEIPDLQDVAGGLKFDLAPNSEGYIGVPLANHKVKDQFADANLPSPRQYVASYVLKGAPDLELTASATVEFGDFVACGEGCDPVSSCAVVPTN